MVFWLVPFFVWLVYSFSSRHFSLIFSERIWRLGAPPPKQQLPDHVWKGLLSDPFSFVLNVSLSFLNGLVGEGLRRKIGLAMNIITLIKIYLDYVFCFVSFVLFCFVLFFLFCVVFFSFCLWFINFMYVF